MIQEVGLENLPNSYISLIEISEWSPKVNLVHTHFILKDIKKGKRFSWYKRGELGKYLKLLVVVSSNSSISTAIDSGDLPLDKLKISNHPDFDATQVQFREIKVGSAKDQILNDPTITPDGELYELEFGDRFYVRKDQRNVKLYCATYIDTQQYSEDYRIDLVSTTISSYTGPVASETVFVNGELSKDSFLFRTATNAIWSGPVRFLNGTYYSGSKGPATPSEVLRRVRVPNLKIKEYRKKKLLSPTPSEVDNKLPIFEPLTVSYNTDGSLSAMFGIDIRSLLLRNSILARRLTVVNENLLQKMVEEIKFENIVVVKQKQILRNITSRSGTPIKSKGDLLKAKVLVRTEDFAPFQLISVNTDMVRFEEIVISESTNMRHFAIRDYENYKAKGDYIYTLELKTQDPTKAYVDNLAKEAEMNLSKLKNYIERSKLKKNQNNSRTRFLDSFVQNELNLFGEETQPWNVATKIYTTYYNLFLSLSETDTKKISDSAIARIHPKFATPLSVDYFIKEYSELHQNFIRYFSAKLKRVSESTAKGSKSKSALQNSIVVKHNYKQVIVHEERDKNIVYYDFKEDIYPIITSKEFVSRAQQEKSKFFKSKPSLVGTGLEKVSKTAAQEMAKQADNIISYFTPNMIVAGDKSLDTSNPATVDLDAFNEVFVKTKKTIFRDEVEPKKLIKKKISIKPAKKIDAYLNKEKDNKKTVDENLGKNSKFRNAEEKFKPIIKSKVVSKIKGKLKSYKKQKISSKQYASDSSKIKNVIKNISTVKLPPSLISVIASESKSTKNNVLTSKVDLVSNQDTKDFFSLMYSNPVQIEVIRSYKKDARGRMIMSSPIWGLLNQEDLEKTTPLVCRFNVFNSKYFESQDMDLNIANENFVLISGSKITKSFNNKEIISMKDILNTIQQTENNKIEYQNSNLIAQSIEKDGPLR